ncbi:MAG: ATP-binding protein [Minwuia sp.]|uniref:sensor histidine kinase n=1 Tax=Minwuia sp. TaxID=2493630 RepID=UPI003A8A0031
MSKMDQMDNRGRGDQTVSRATDDRGEVFAEALENISEAIVIYDADGLLVACNRNFRDLYGYTEAEAAPGVHFAELGRIDVERGNVVVGDQYGGGEAYLARKAEYRKRLTGSFIVRLSDGRWIKTTDRPMRRGGFVSVQVDVTDMKRAEEELIEAKESAEAASRQKSEFLANISHDLRTPLNSIIGFSDMMLSEAFGPVGHEKYREYAESIQFSGRLLLSLVGDILDTAKMESGNLDLSPTDLDPVALSGQVARNFEPATLEKGLTLDVAAEPDFPATVRADERALTQILNNLLSNACKHTPQGGSVSIHWSRLEDGLVELAVSDTGPGMPAALAERLGEPFLHDAAYVADGERGTGLGLYICKKLAQAMDGAISIEASPETGTTVRVAWPG